MSESSLARFTALSGLATVALYAVVAVLMGDAPEINAPEDAVLEWIRAHRTQMLVSAYGWGLCVVATFCFLTGLWGLLRNKEGGPGVFSTMGLAGGYSIFSVALLGFVFALGAAYRADTLSASTAKLLNDLTLLGVALSGFPTVVSMVGFTVVMAQQSLFARWLRAFAVLTIVAHLLSGGAFAASGLLSPSGVGVYVAPVMYYFWILALSVHLLVWGKNPRFCR